MNKLLDALPFGPIVMLGAVYAIMPIFPEPHLVQKAQWLMAGMPMKPIDWLDIVLHGGAGIIALLRFLRYRQVNAQNDSQNND